MAHNTRKQATIPPVSASSQTDDQLQALQIRLDEQEHHYSQLFTSSMDNVHAKIQDLQQEHQHTMDSMLHEQDLLRTENKRTMILMEEMKQDQQRSVSYLASLIQGLTLPSSPLPQSTTIHPTSTSIKGKEPFLPNSHNPIDSRGLLPTPADPNPLPHHQPLSSTNPQFSPDHLPKTDPYHYHNHIPPDPISHNPPYFPYQDRHHSDIHQHSIPYFSKLLPKCALPSFDGSDCNSWLLKCTKYFQICTVPATRQVDLVGLFLYDKAEAWFLNWSQNKDSITWEEFTQAISSRFRDTAEGNVVEEFQKLRQDGTVDS